MIPTDNSGLVLRVKETEAEYHLDPTTEDDEISIFDAYFAFRGTHRIFQIIFIIIIIIPVVIFMAHSVLFLPHYAEYVPGSVNITQYQFGTTILNDYRGKVIFEGKELSFQKTLSDSDNYSPIQLPGYGGTYPNTTILMTWCLVHPSSQASQSMALKYQANDFKAILERHVGEIDGCMKGNILEQYYTTAFINNLLIKNRWEPKFWELWSYSSKLAARIVPST